MRRSSWPALTALSLTMLLAGCSSSQQASTQGEQAGKDQQVGKGGDLVIYSGRKEKLFLPVVKAFEKKSGVTVRLKQGKTAELANAILEEAVRPQADLFVAQEAGTLEKLRLEGALHPHKPASFDDIPADFKAKDGAWIGVSGRARVIMYNTDLLAKEEAPTSVFELTDPKWKGKLAMASSQEASVVGWVSALRLVKGEKFTREYLKGLLANDIEALGNHSEVRKAVGKGEFAVGLVNHYYFHLEKKAGSPVEVIYPDQGADDMGVLVNSTGVAILKGARNLHEAEAFVDFLITPETQKLFASSNFEYPTLPEVAPVEAKPFDEFKRTPITLDQLGAEVDETLGLLSELGIR